MRALAGTLVGLLVVALVLSDLRFLRVAQREHYLPGEVTLFARRWWASRGENLALFLAGAVGALAAVRFVPLAALPALASGIGPIGLGPRGRTSRLAWTRRLVTLAAATATLEGAAVAVGAALSGLAGAVAAGGLSTMLAPAAVDLALFSTRPLEERLARRFVRRARARLERVHPLVVAVTGSYGKTTVKGYIAHLVGRFRTTLPSPKSYNNRAGLARTVNEYLGPATEVLVAEMGTYGLGEIAEMCRLMRPEISVITAIGPAHLERFGSLETTLRAKAEIAETARVVVLNVDDPRLAHLAGELRESGKKVVAASAVGGGDVVVRANDRGIELEVGGHRLGMASVAPADRPTALSNAAVAVAVALELGVPETEILARLATLPLPANRLQRYTAETGYVVYDDTFNSNPTGARLALERLAADPAVAPGGRRAVVTPGMVELGPTQRAENAAFAAAAARVADVLILVGRTNRAALREGAAQAGGAATVLEVDRLDDALAWVRGNLAGGDAVLYENDLPDHYP